MRGLLLVGHGSRRAASNDEIEALAESMIQQTDSGYDRVQAAFLELASPSISDGVDLLLQQSIREIVIVPYFLAAGRHVSEDIPAIVDKLQADHPGVDIRLTSHIGASGKMANLILECASHE